MKIGPFGLGAGLVSFALAAFGCSSSNKATGTLDSGSAANGTPAVEITAPIEGASVSVAQSADLPVELKVTNFTLKDFARTDGTSCPKGSCGHIHLLVDDGDGKFTACNNKDAKPPATPPPYNTAAVALTGNTVGLDYCPQMNGLHTIKAELHNDDRSPVNGPDGKVITSNLVHVTATGGPDGG
jgi:hypothetical protein